jgi:hypothetical protein
MICRRASEGGRTLDLLITNYMFKLYISFIACLEACFKILRRHSLPEKWGGGGESNPLSAWL